MLCHHRRHSLEPAWSAMTCILTSCPTRSIARMHVGSAATPTVQLGSGDALMPARARPLVRGHLASALAGHARMAGRTDRGQEGTDLIGRTDRKNEAAQVTRRRRVVSCLWPSDPSAIKASTCFCHWWSTVIFTARPWLSNRCMKQGFCLDR